jgi:hypothetical protein
VGGVKDQIMGNKIMLLRYMTSDASGSDSLSIFISVTKRSKASFLGCARLLRRIDFLNRK